MNRPRAHGPGLVLGAVLFVLFDGLACRDGGQSSVDAAADYVAVDLPAMADGAAVPLALDFSATGCASFDPALPRCSGTAPLTLSFTPVASATLTRFLWTFGDDTPNSSDRSATHTYSLPGSYAVTLVGLAPGSGSVQESHDGYVNVLAAPIGAWCDVDSQCDNLTCLCGSLSPCSPVLSRGLCSQACDAASGGASVCPDGTTCADLSTGTTSAVPPMTPTTNTTWRRALCLPSCTDDTTCAPGLRCRDLPIGDPAGGWTRACFGAYPLDIGARCGDTQGTPVDADCASHLCADLGDFYRCAADCSTVACPDGTGCAHFGDGRRLCLAACSAAADGGVADAAVDATGNPTPATSTPPAACDDDPLLACQASGGTGAWGFTLPDAAPGATYCSPKRCTTNVDCAPSGTCPAGGGSCQRQVATP